MDEMAKGKSEQVRKFAEDNGLEVIEIKHSSDRLKLATEMETVQSAWNRMQNVYNQWIEGAIIHKELAHALVLISVELADSLPETDDLGNPI